MSTEWTERDYKKLWSTGNLKEGKNEADPEKPGKMGYMQRWVRDGIYTAMGERWDIYSDG